MPSGGLYCYSLSISNQGDLNDSEIDTGYYDIGEDVINFRELFFKPGNVGAGDKGGENRYCFPQVPVIFN